MVELKRKVTFKTKSAAPEEDAAEKVHLKKKVTIKEKHADEELPNGGSNGGNPTPPPEPPKGKKWKLWLIVIVILTLFGYLWYSHSSFSSPEDGTGAASTKVENTDSTKAQPSDSISTANSSKDEATEAGDETVIGPKVAIPTGESMVDSEKETTALKKVQGPRKESSDVSDISKPKSETNVPSGSVEETASEILKGIYGNGDVRKNKLGSRYHEVQNRVNEMYRQGLVR